MIDYQILIIILFAHWIADFVLQTDWMAQGKSKEMTPLIAHGISYTGGFALIIIIGLSISGYSETLDVRYILKFIFLNGLLHTITDFFTSRASSYFWQQKQVHNFFVVIGFDQMIHTVTILITWNWLFN